MIESTIDNPLARGQIVVSPNRSSSWRGTKIFLLAISCFALAIGWMFAQAGYWLVLPFTGLEIIVLSIAMYTVSRQGYHQEVISLENNRIRVEKGSHTPQVAWDAELFWTRLVVDKAPHRWYPKKLFLRSQQQQIEIGAFLTEDEKKKLVKELRSLMHLSK